MLAAGHDGRLWILSDCEAEADVTAFEKVRF